MQITGQQLIRLLEGDGWHSRSGRGSHVVLVKHLPGEGSPRSTVVQDKPDSLPPGTLAAILSVRQTGLGREGLQRLIDTYGL
ncbi:MAG: type II toxin-antitoxin system HicA family toxin [Dehalococcoidia bacterium]|nr:type II toxin-antitoxin system HicA family toxin [Dehalococcoidia bacterium]